MTAKPTGGRLEFENGLLLAKQERLEEDLKTASYLLAQKAERLSERAEEQERLQGLLKTALNFAVHRSKCQFMALGPATYAGQEQSCDCGLWTLMQEAGAIYSSHDHGEEASNGK